MPVLQVTQLAGVRGDKTRCAEPMRGYLPTWRPPLGLYTHTVGPGSSPPGDPCSWFHGQQTCLANLLLPLARPPGMGFCAQNRPGALGQAGVGGGACLEHEAGRASNSVDSLYPPQGRGLCISSIPRAQGFLHLGCAVSLTFPGCLVAVLSYTEPDGMGPVRSSPNSLLTAASVHCGAEEHSQGLWGSRGLSDPH